MALALWGPFATITKATALITLMVFATVNLALIVIKRRSSNSEGLMV
jgi:amino acid transporter